MVRYRHDKNQRRANRRIPWQGQEKPLPQGKVRCGSCQQPAGLTPNKHLRAHDDGAGVPCPNRISGLEEQFDLQDMPPVKIRPEPKTIIPTYDERKRQQLPPVKTGYCLTPGCGKFIGPDRMYCGQCARKRNSKQEGNL